MLNLNKLYVKKDFENGGSWWIPKEEAKGYNDRNFGIFWAPNMEEGETHRLKENVKKIYWWFADMDEKLSGGKKEQYDRIMKLSCKPNWVVETKNGYHCYWKAKNGTVENWDRIIRGIINTLGSDPARKDQNGLMRAVGYYHCKDPNNKFLIKTVFETDEEFSEREMMFFFKAPKEKKIDFDAKYSDIAPDEWVNPDNFERLYHVSRISEGNRNVSLRDKAYKAFIHGVTGNDLLTLLLKLNVMMPCKSLPEQEIKAMIRRLR